MTTNPSYSSIPSAGPLPFPLEGNDSNRVKEVMVDTRINKVLALRTDSVAMLEALNSISEFYSTSKFIAIILFPSSIYLNFLFSQSDTVEARRALRYNLETYNVENGKKFLQELTFMKQQLDETENLSNELNNICSLLKLKVEKADSNMKNFIDKTSSLEKNKSQLMQGKEQIEYFLLKFHMNDEDIHFLNSANLNHSNEFTIFFNKLMKLKDSFHECQKLAEQQQLQQQQQQQQQYSVNSPSSSGPISPLAVSNKSNIIANGIIQFELLEVLGTQKENAYHYLFQWIKEKCELFSEHHHHASSSSSSSTTGNMNQVMNLIALEENNDLMHKLQISIAHIKDIPIYFQQCQDLLIPAKRNILMNRFMIALTQGESNNNNNSSGPSHSHSSSSNSSGDRMKTALDLQSHDPMLYVGSILAWMHQAVAAEREYIEAIYNDHYHHPQPISRSNTGSTANLSTKVNESHQFDILARIVQTVAKPLRIRILQTLENHNSIDILYGLADLLLFYETIFLKLLPIENAIHACIKGCLNECKNLFRQAMKKQIDYLTNTTNQSLLSPNPLLGGVSNVSTSSSSSYLELKVSSTTREYSKLISNILKICCSSLSNLPFLTHFPTSAEIIGLASASSTPRVGNAASTSTSVPPAGAADTSLPNTNYFQMDVVLGDLIQPLLQYCRIQVSKLPSAEMAIYMLNNIGFLQVIVLLITSPLS